MSPPEVIRDDDTYITLPASLKDEYFESKPISYSKYFESFEFKFNELSNDFNLINIMEIQDFILLHDDLFDYLSQIKLLLQNYFSEYDYCLEFYSDPELQSLNQLVIYINGDESSFDEDWSSLKRMNSEINELGNFPNSVKHLISVDLW